MDKLRMESPDMTALNIDRIAVLFPNCITEMLDEEHSTPEKKVYKRAVNFELLKQMLSPDVVDGDEAYEFTWVGKKAAIVEANKPIRKTLRPVLKDETIPTGADSEGKPYCSSGSKDWDTTENLYIEGDNGSPQALAGELSWQGQDDLYRPAVQHRQRLHLCR